MLKGQLNIKPILTVIALLLSLAVNAQQGEIKGLLNKVMDFYTNTDEYYIDINYKMFKGLTGNQVTESYDGILVKKGAFYKMEVLGTEVLQFGDEKLVLDHNNKLVSYAKDQVQSPAELLANMDTFIKYYDKSQILDKGSGWVCEFVSSEKSIQQLPYGKVLLFINKKTNALTKQELYFSSAVPFKGKDGDTEYDYGRLIITLKSNSQKEKEIKNRDDYLKSTPGGKIELQESLSAYKIVDQNQ